MKQALALVVSIILGLLAVFAMKNYINREKSQNVSTVEMVDVLFVKRQLNPGTSLKRSDVMAKEMPKDSVTADMVKPHEIIEITGKVVRRGINRHGPLFHSDFLSETRKTVSSIAEGRRLVSIPVSQISGVSGLIKPGNRVDILFTSSDDSKTGSTSKTVLLMENISVYATDNQTINIPERFGLKKRASYSALTLSVTTDEAAILTSAVNLGSLQFILRSNEDFNRVKHKIEINKKNILQKAQQANQSRWNKIKN